MAREGDVLFETLDLTVRYGGVLAVDHVSVRIGYGELVGIIGPNGAGKTTFIDAVTGFTQSTGDVRLNGRDIKGLPSHARSKAGLVRTFQQLELFDDLSIRDNLLVARYPKGPWWSVLVDMVMPKRHEDVAEVDQALALLGMSDLADAFPNELSTGWRKLAAVGRALMGDAPLLLLDEPAAGLSHVESAQLGGQLKALVSPERSLLLVDHDMDLVMSICDRIYVLDLGRVIAEGPPAEVRRDKAVTSAYLGVRG